MSSGNAGTVGTTVDFTPPSNVSLLVILISGSS
jgi:hypothetical protein